jgi:hypothetical protein
MRPLQIVVAGSTACTVAPAWAAISTFTCSMSPRQREPDDRRRLTRGHVGRDADDGLVEHLGRQVRP